MRCALFAVLCLVLLSATAEAAWLTQVDPFTVTTKPALINGQGSGSLTIGPGFVLGMIEVYDLKVSTSSYGQVFGTGRQMATDTHYALSTDSAVGEAELQKSARANGKVKNRKHETLARASGHGLAKHTFDGAGTSLLDTLKSTHIKSDQNIPLPPVTLPVGGSGAQISISVPTATIGTGELEENKLPLTETPFKCPVTVVERFTEGEGEMVVFANHTLGGDIDAGLTLLARAASSVVAGAIAQIGQIIVNINQGISPGAGLPSPPPVIPVAAPKAEANIWCYGAIAEHLLDHPICP